MVNNYGHAVLGFSGSASVAAPLGLPASVPGYLSGFYAGMASYNSSFGPIKLLRPGQASLTGVNGRAGDYSATSLDPLDRMSLWTIQEYAIQAPSTWGTWIGQVIP